MGKDVRRISTPAINMMVVYHWPGNVRELENCIERAVLLSTDGVIHGHHLPPTLQTSDASDTIGEGTLQARVDLFERGPHRRRPQTLQRKHLRRRPRPGLHGKDRAVQDREAGD